MVSLIKGGIASFRGATFFGDKFRLAGDLVDEGRLLLDGAPLEMTFAV
jgi:hypothetical protein